MMPRQLKIAVASFAHVHAAGYATLLASMPDVTLLCADPDGAQTSATEPGQLRGRALADHLGVSYVDTYEELFAWKPDGVIICSENTRHGELIEMAAAAGVPMLCEKPLAVTRAEAQRYTALAADAGVFLMVAYPVRFAAEFQDLATAIRRNELGSVVALSGTNNGKIPVGDRRWFTDPRLAGGGALVDHTVHVADLADALFESEPVRVRAVSNQILHRAVPGVDAETAGLVQVEYANGLSLSIDCSWSQPSQAPVWGGLTLDVLTTTTLAHIAPFGHGLSGMTDEGRRALFLGFGENLDAKMIDAFKRGIRDGHAPVPDGAAGTRTATIVEAALISAAYQGGVVDCATMQVVSSAS
ncbi:MAG: Gfo/Idh/MocA family oxidoreductase [Actinomyces urogenitalis]|jgi:predicted dehydrogenase|nr:Gfo/Idh/MocA family oxidoreductase [Actinomyces urogenitalis]KGE98903.1 hypothetical protein HMPREF1626_10605 [Actinomyces urogenitalis S6-C4]MBS5977500.1 Gfo/Idh/MocA family oxidoreductase [Actinomyces urogenitalis]MBS6072353.1 Gfo/Idh/MocA family oxidoreductase [Actinomyces urogenitalis]MDK8236861.1 Gfo/Idh/MocA family oxidoreductase [Actinomyces urogenitalis]MDK8835318.1 Gfo/Idh/MocA family oxidoreductase [Actinomyces urogenitalis]